MNPRYAILGPYTRDEFHKWFRDSNDFGKVLQVDQDVLLTGEPLYRVIVELSEEQTKVLREPNG